MEIQVPLKLSQDEECLLDMHGVLNVLNVINFELFQIREILGDDDAILELISEVNRAGRLLRNPDASHRLVAGIDDFIEGLHQTLDSAAARHPEVNPEQILPYRHNLDTVCRIIRIRAREILTRHQTPDEWVSWDVESLNGNFVDFLAALEQNSHGGYRIVPNLAAQQEGDYFVQFLISSEKGPTLRMPMVFQDVMRDLLANARKYTPPGGIINGGLHATHEHLRFVVKDSGVGIPSKALPDVVLFGKRADNVKHRQTRGGGFGLTKAYYVTRRYGGRMWIESCTGDASNDSFTRVEITIPYPVEG